MKTSVINYSMSRQKGLRFDASFHLSDGLIARRQVESSPYGIFTIKDVSTNIFYGNRAKRIYVTKPEHGIPFLSSSDILRANLESVKLASKKYTPCIEQMTLQKGWILISRSGTIGNCAFTNAKHAQKLASEHVIRINPNNILKSGLVYAYLASQYGHSLLTQGTFGAVIQHIEPDFVASFPIPNFSEALQRKVDDLIQESAKLREEASVMIRKAKSILLNYCNADFRKNNFKTAVVKNTDILFSLQHRIDPPALINDGVIAINKIEQIKKTVKLKDTGAKVFRPGIFKRCYVSNGYPYIKGSDIFNINPFIRCSYLSRKNTPFVNEMLLHEGQILVTCAGSVGNIKLITKEYDDKEALGSQDIIRIETTNNLFTKEYLFIYLQLPFVYDYIQSMKYGSVIERVEPFHIESIPVVQPTVKISEEITSLVRRYMECTYKAFVEEETAIKEVEQEIESWNKK